jgi:LmbE family N-acetylglucosaminyl deacetylase
VKRRTSTFIVLFFVLTSPISFGLETTNLPAFPPVTAQDRIVIVAPHPDDEALATGGLIQSAMAQGASVHVIYFTSGDHNQIAFKLYCGRLFLRAPDYLKLGKMRRQEAINATTVLGLSTNQLAFLGYPDWGTLRIWCDYWKGGKLFCSDATRVTAVPYPESFAYKRPYTPESVETNLARLLRQLRPTKLFITHPADTNPDHRAVANFTRLALLDLQPEHIQPEVYYFVVHFGGWTKPLGYHPDLQLSPPSRLLDNGSWLSLPLTPAQTQAKEIAILENRTQITIGQRFLLSLARSNEIFATMPVASIPVVPESVPLDWRAAVRNKSIQYHPQEPNGKLHDTNEQPVTLALEETDFIRRGSDLIALIEYKNRLGCRSNVHLFLYPYRQGVPFGDMPKVQINLPPLGGVKVYVDGKLKKEKTVTHQRVADRSFVCVPLRLLTGNSTNMPDHVFTCTRANLGEISPDDTAWQLFSLQP